MALTILAAVPTAIVVLGHEAERVSVGLEGLKLTTVVNPDRAGSQMSSVRTGLAAAPVAAGHLIYLADQPSLTAADDAFVLKAADRAPDKIVVPIRQGHRGNPILLPAAVVADLAHEGINTGC